MLVFATLGTVERRRLPGRRRTRPAAPNPDPAPVSTGRATVIDVGEPLDEVKARAWLARAGEAELAAGLQILDHALQVFRQVTTDPDLHTVGRRQLLVGRVGYGAGEQVADGLWTDAREVMRVERRRRRVQVLTPQSRLAAVLGGHEPVLISEELILRAREDIDAGHERRAALQVLVALDAALAELPAEPGHTGLGERLEELRGQREAVAAAAQAALGGPLSPAECESVSFTLGRLEAALRARAVNNG